jgi:hypothetical protein
MRTIILADTDTAALLQMIDAQLTLTEAEYAELRRQRDPQEIVQRLQRLRDIEIEWREER